MNREIKFRAWDSTARRFGIFKLGDLSGYEGEGGSHVLITPRLTLSSNGIFNKDLTIQQFTGLKDKNGKEIYEGDILNISRDIVDKARVVETESHVCEVYYGTDGFWLKGRFVHRRIADWDVEVTGNIFENPELLK